MTRNTINSSEPFPFSGEAGEIKRLIDQDLKASNFDAAATQIKDASSLLARKGLSSEGRTQINRVRPFLKEPRSQVHLAQASAALYYAEGRFDQCAASPTDASNLDPSDTKQRALCLNDLGVVALHIQEDTKQAIDYHKQAFALRLEGGNARDIASSINNMGWTLWTEAERFPNPQSIALRRKAINLAEIASSLRALPGGKESWGGAGSHYTLGFFKSSLAEFFPDSDEKQEFLAEAKAYRRGRTVLFQRRFAWPV